MNQRQASVLLIHQSFALPSQGGGTRHFELGRKLVEWGGQFSVVSSSLDYLTGSKIIGTHGLVTAQMVDGVRILRAYTYPSLHRSYSWRVLSFLSFMLTSLWAALKTPAPDVVMGTSPPIFQCLSALVVSLLRRRPFLLEVRDLWPEFAIDIGLLRNKALIRLSRWLEGFLYRRARHIIVNSPAYRDYLIGKQVPAGKITVIANGVDPEMFDPCADGQSVREEFGLGGKFVVVYAGALGMANDVDTLLRAAARLGGDGRVHFLLVGDGKERARLEAWAQEQGLKNVTFTGSRPKRDMPAFLAAADAGVAILKPIPMFNTTYPNKVFDYMAAGRPTVLAIDGVIRQVMEAANGGVFVEPGDDRALADAVASLAADPQRARAMGSSARDHVARHFNRTQQAADFAVLVSQVASCR